MSLAPLGLCIALGLGAQPAAGAGAASSASTNTSTAPKRIATLAPSLTEIVLALGKGDSLVGVSRYDDAPEVAKVPRLGGLMDPSPEAILAAKPDLLLVEPNPANKEVLSRIEKLGLKIVQVDLGTLAEVENAERSISAALGVPELGASLADKLKAHLVELNQRHVSQAKPRVLLVYGWQPLVVAGPHSFADELIEAAGGINAASDAKSAYATYSAEAAAAAKPDVLVDASYGESIPAALTSLPGLAQARRVKPKSLALLRPGPRLTEALDDLEALLHPAPSPAAHGNSPRRASLSLSKSASCAKSMRRRERPFKCDGACR
jgi:iron complex transport system substrate-binding protein